MQTWVWNSYGWFKFFFWMTVLGKKTCDGDSDLSFFPGGCNLQIRLLFWNVFLYYRFQTWNTKQIIWCKMFFSGHDPQGCKKNKSTKKKRNWINTVDGRNPANQLRLIVYPTINYKVLYIPGGWPWDFWTINSFSVSPVSWLTYPWKFHWKTGTIDRELPFLTENWLHGQFSSAFEDVSPNKKWWFSIVSKKSPTVGPTVHGSKKNLSI